MGVDDRHLAELRTRGYTVVEDFVPPERIAAVSDAAASQFAPPEEVAGAPDRHRVDAKGLSFRVFPYEPDVLNHLTVDESLLALGETYFDGQAPFLTQSLIRATYPHPGSADQDLHRDYTDNGLLAPSDDPRFGQLAILVYLTDVTVDHAPTYVCSRTDTDDRALTPRSRSRAEDPALYAHERPVAGRAGTASLYTFSTFHRGSRFVAPAGWRLALHLVLRPAGCEWMSFSAFGTAFERPSAVRLMETASPRQRSLLGVPMPGDAYWTPQTVAGVSARYPGMDMSPYADALT